MNQEYNKENFFETEGKSEYEAMKFFKENKDVSTYLISCICPVEKGFVLGFSGIPLFMVYMINPETDLL